MTIKFKAFAAVKGEKDEWKRIAESMHEIEKEAEKVAENYAKIHSDSVTGTHKYYIISRKEWADKQYKDVSLADGKTKTWMTNEGNGCVLLFEGTHFEIA